MAEQKMRLRVVLDLVDKALAPLKRIGEGSSQTARALKAAKDQLKAMGDTQKAIGDFRQARNGLADLEAKLGAAREKARALAVVYGQVGPPTKAMHEAMSKARAEANAAGAAFNAQQQRIQQLRDKLSAAGISTRNLSEHERKLRSDIEATTAGITRQTDALRQQSEEQRRLARIRHQSARVAAMGGGMAAAGTGMVYGANRAMHAAVPVMGQTRHAATEQMRIQALGLGDDESRKAVEFAKSFKSYGTSQLDNLELMRDAITVFNDRHHAEEAMPILAKMKFANEAAFGSAQGEDNARKFMDMMKVIEMRGGANNKEDFERNANYVQQVITATGGRVGASDWMHVIQRGKLAAKGFDEKEFFYRLEPLVQEMGGDAVGTGLTAAYQNLYQGRTTKRAAQNLDSLGLIGDYSKVKHDKVGQTAQLNPGALKGSDIFRRSQFEWMEKILIPALRAKGIESEQATIDAIGSIFSNTNGGALMATMYQQRAMVQKGYELNSKAANIDELAKLSKASTGGQEIELLKRRDDLYMRMGDAALPGYVKLLEVLTGITEKISAWTAANPGLTQAILYAGAGVAILMAGLGALLIPIGLLLAKSMLLRFAFAKMAAGFAASGGAAVALAAAQWLVNTPAHIARWIAVTAQIWAWRAATAAAAAGAGLMAAAQWVLNASVMGFPLVWIIAAIAAVIAAGYMLYQNWDSVVSGGKLLWQGFTAYLGGIWSEFVAYLSSVWSLITTNASTAWQGMVTMFTDFGSNIVSGIISGITGRLGELRDTVVGVANSAAGWFREKLGIASPSKVFTQYGGWISEGAANGIQAGQAGVRAAALAMAGAALVPVGMAQAGDMGAGGAPAGLASMAAMAPLASASAAGAGMGTGNITINIHAQPGMDERAIARLVAQELERIEQRKGFTARSRLQDLD